jgi:IclR family acetate operon transcriptional repressor
VGSLEKALKVIEAVAETQPVGVSDLARQLDMPKSSVQRSLIALHDAGWIRPTGTELTRWVITTKVLTIGSHAGEDLGIRPVAVPVMQTLRDETSETINLTVPGDHNHVVVLIERLESPQVVRTSNPVGAVAPIHASSNGKAVLAHLPEAEVDAVIAQGLQGFTESTLVSPDDLKSDLAQIRQCGYATNIGEWRSSTASVASAILNENGRPVAALSISAPVDRMPTELRPRYGELVTEAAAKIQRDLGFRPRHDGG